MWYRLYVMHINVSGYYVVHKNVVYDLCSSPNITWVIKSRRMRWAGHVANMQKRRDARRVWG